MNRKIYFKGILLFLLFSSCKDIIVKKTETRKSKYKREMIRYDLGKNTYQDLEIYINKNNDTIGFQTKTYENNILDSTRSKFYSLKLSKTINNKTLKVNSLEGTLKYHFDSIKEGKLIGIFFIVSTKINNRKDKKTFKNYDFKKKELKFSFKNDNDTLMGIMFAQHTKDTIVNGEKKVRIRKVIIAVDNHIETNNPFVDFKL